MHVCDVLSLSQGLGEQIEDDQVKMKDPEKNLFKRLQLAVVKIRIRNRNHEWSRGCQSHREMSANEQKGERSQEPSEFYVYILQKEL